MAGGDVKFRRAVADDAAVVAHIVAMAFGEELTRRLCGEAGETLFEELARRDDTQYSYRNVLVCEADGEVVGAVCGYDGAKLQELRVPVLETIRERCGSVPEVADETSAGEFYLDTLGVLPRAQGRGLGAELIRRMRDEAFAEGHERVTLLVDEDNTAAERLYERLGFSRCGEVDLLGHRMFRMECRK